MVLAVNSYLQNSEKENIYRYSAMFIEPGFTAVVCVL